jgi:LPXTG-site transpeptidase (sortase) family protein
MGTAMRTNVIGAALVLAGLVLIGGAASGLGLLSPHAAVTQAASGPGAAPMPLLHRDPVSLPGVHSSGPTGPNITIASISIPSLGVHAPVFERGVDPGGNMVIAHGYAVTHFQYSAAIGSGNAVLYGHDDIEGSVFARLKDLKIGDEIDVLVVGSPEPIVWRVTGRAIVPPTDVKILEGTGDVRLTLFTCWPNWVDTKRVVVTAAPA